MSINKSMNRRRFLAVIGGTGGALGLAGLGGWRLLTGRLDSGSNSFDATVPDAGVEVINVAAGFIDATVWHDQLLTLRASREGTSIALRSETSGHENLVHAPEDFTARCVGVIDNKLLIGGHSEVEHGRIEFDVGPDYSALAAEAGELADIFLNEPAEPVVGGHTHVFVDTVPTLLVSVDLERWDVCPTDKWHRGGSVGAVLESGGIIAADQYLDSEVPDSVFEVMFMQLEGILEGVKSVARAPIAVDHGALWGLSHDGHSDIAVVTDRKGTRGYDDRGKVVFSVGPEDAVLGIEPHRNGVRIAVELSGGGLELRDYLDGSQFASTELAAGTPILHRIGSSIGVASSSGKSGYAIKH